MNAKRTIVIVGCALLGLTIAAVVVVAVIAIVEGGGGMGVDYRGTGRSAVFMPIAYIPLLVALVVAGAIWLRRRFGRHRDDGVQSKDVRLKRRPHN